MAAVVVAVAMAAEVLADVAAVEVGTGVLEALGTLEILAQPNDQSACSFNAK